MDRERYNTDPAYRRMVEGARKGGRSRSEKKLKAVRENARGAGGRPRKDGMANKWQERGLTREEARAEFETGVRRREGRRVQELMAHYGWRLSSELEWTEVRSITGRLMEEETWTEIALGEIRVPDEVESYRRWAREDGKRLDETTTNFPPDRLMRALCRLRVSESACGLEEETGEPEMEETEEPGEEEGIDKEKEAERKIALMAAHGWSLRKEWDWTAEQEFAGQEEEAEEETGEVLGVDRGHYELWRGDCKNLCAENLHPFPPDSMLRKLCRYRTGETAEADGFRI